MPTKKTPTKFRQQMLWFIGLYICSVLAFGVFHALSHGLVALLSGR